MRTRRCIPLAVALAWIVLALPWVSASALAAEGVSLAVPRGWKFQDPRKLKSPQMMAFVRKGPTVAATRALRVYRIGPTAMTLADFRSTFLGGLRKKGQKVTSMRRVLLSNERLPAWRVEADHPSRGLHYDYWLFSRGRALYWVKGSCARSSAAAAGRDYELVMKTLHFADGSR